MGVNVPASQKKSDLQEIGGIGGAIVGGVYGGPGGAAGGAAAGSQLGGMVDPAKSSQVQTADSGSAMQRRQDNLAQFSQPSAYEQQLAQAENAAQQLPAQQQQQYLPIIQAARQRAQGVA